MDASEIYNQVNERYGSIVGSRSGRYEQSVAEAFGYTAEELADLPSGANLGLSCGNPLALANLNEGETVIDLGSGGGLDVFTAAKKVGPTGKAIGIDMNKNMIHKANINKAKVNAPNVEFIESPITSIPLPDSTADCIISNCVINLVPASEKQLAFNEMARLLKPGGRVAISDVLARKELPDEVKKDVALYVGCIAGASQVAEYEAYLKNAGFKEILIVDSNSDLNVYFTTPMDEGSCCGATESTTHSLSTNYSNGEVVEKCCTTNPTTQPRQDQERGVSQPDGTNILGPGAGITDFNEWAGSFKVYAVKPAAV